jgi:alpha-L-fucosidase 2
MHILRYTTPAMTWDEALPLGNGILGALVWGDGAPLRISLDRTDLWDLRVPPEFSGQEYAYAQLRRWRAEGAMGEISAMYDGAYAHPYPTKIPAGRIEIALPGTRFGSGTLRLADATVELDLGPVTGEVFVDAARPVGLILLRGVSSVMPRLLAPAFGGEAEAVNDALASGFLAQLGYPGPQETSGTNWCAFYQQGSFGFSFAVYLAWQESDEGWLAAWSVASSCEGDDPLTVAKQRVEAALAKGLAELHAEHAAWWQAFWAQSAVRLPNEVLERQWYLEQYKFGAASRRGSPPITLQGPWTADTGRLPPWKGDYHHDLNTQLSYWPCYSANHLDEGLSYLDWLWQTRPNCQEWTRTYYGLPGMNVPGVADLNNAPLGGWVQYSFSSTTAAWLAHHFYLHWRYSADRAFLADQAYPYLKDVATFIEAITTERDGDGKRTLPLSSSPEVNDNRLTAWFDTITNYDLSLIRWLMTATAELADELGLTSEAAGWRSVLDEFPELAYADDGRLLVAADFPLPESHRHFSHLMAIHPLGLIDWEDEDAARQTIRAALAELERLGPDYWCGYSYSWLGNLAARAREGEAAEKALEIFSRAFCLRNSFHANGDQSGKGYSKFTYRPFTLEGNFAAAAGIQEMLLQSQRGVVRVFPAVPAAWVDVSFDTLRAEGAFLVSARRENGRTTWVRIIAERGGECRLISPFSGTELTLKMEPGQSIELTHDP